MSEPFDWDDDLAECEHHAEACELCRPTEEETP